MPDKRNKSDRDVINIENAGTDKAETWITIKEASDLLGYSERHTWRIANKNGWKQKKMLNNFRRKVYVLKDEVNQFYKQEQERQKTEKEKSDKFDKPDKSAEFDKSDKEMSDSFKAQNQSKAFPILMSEYKKIQEEYHRKQEKLIKDKAFWKTSALWFICLGFIIFGFLGYYIYDTKLALSDKKQELSDIRLRLSEKDKQMQELTKRVNSLSDKVMATQKSLLNTKETINSKNKWINLLEESIADKKIEQIKQGRRKDENKESKDNKQN